jgi:hypothetical protein
MKPTQPEAVPVFWIVSTAGRELASVAKVIGPKAINDAEALTAPARKSKLHAGNFEFIMASVLFSSF